MPSSLALSIAALKSLINFWSPFLIPTPTPAPKGPPPKVGPVKTTLSSVFSAYSVQLLAAARPASILPAERSKLSSSCVL